VHSVINIKKFFIFSKFIIRQQEKGRTTVSGLFSDTEATERRSEAQTGRTHSDGVRRSAGQRGSGHTEWRRPENRISDQRMSVSLSVPEHSHGLRGHQVCQEWDGNIGRDPRTKCTHGRNENAVRETQLLLQT